MRKLVRQGLLLVRDPITKDFLIGFHLIPMKEVILKGGCLGIPGTNNSKKWTCKLVFRCTLGTSRAK